MGAKSGHVGLVRLAKPHLFDECEGRFPQFRQPRQGYLCCSEILTFHERGIRFDFGVERILFVQVGEEFLSRLGDQEFNQKLGRFEMLGRS